ncbi:MAG: magnesium transporter [Planctomycetes bacterium]|nr:magnesium transporter [Planctomycetota bacterium]
MSNPGLSYDELHDAWPLLTASDRVEGFTLLSREESEELFDTLDAREQAELILDLPPGRRRVWVRLLAPDDAADVVQEAEDEQDRAALLDQLDEPTRKEVLALLAYAEDEAGGLMNPRFARLRPDMTVDAAISYLRRQREGQVETIYYAYVLDNQQHLKGVVSLRDLVTAPPSKQVREVMNTEIISAQEQTDQEALANLFAEHDLTTVPVLDESGHMKGIVTVDDIVDVVREEATEDMQKIGGTEALEAPYLQVGLLVMLRKRAGWLAIFVLPGFLSVMALDGFKTALERAGFLVLFLPLIIASGGNSGSQAATLVVRAMALDEFRVRDWWRVIRRELTVGLSLGAILGVIGFATTMVYLSVFEVDTAGHNLLVAVTVACSILGVALWGTIAGSMLPFVLRRCGFDPAAASAPLVATLVDASGLVIYLGIASVVLRDTLFAT